MVGVNFKFVFHISIQATLHVRLNVNVAKHFASTHLGTVQRSQQYTQVSTPGFELQISPNPELDLSGIMGALVHIFPKVSRALSKHQSSPIILEKVKVAGIVTCF